MVKSSPKIEKTQGSSEELSLEDTGKRPRKAFRRHNREVWDWKSSNTSGSVLVELNSMCSSHVAYSYLANIISVRGDLQIEAMVASPSKWARVFLNGHRLVRRVLWSMVSPHFRVYRSFGASDVIGPTVKGSRSRRRKARAVAGSFLSQVASKTDFLVLRVENVQVGDLIYDSFLAKYKVATADLTSRQFQDFFQQSLSDFIYWCDVFDSGRVQAVVVSHSVYSLAIPARVAISRGASAFVANGAWVYSLSKKFLGTFRETAHYPSIAKQLDPSEIQAGCQVASERLGRRLGGESGVDMPYSSGSSFDANHKDRVLPKTDKPKVVIVSHAFFDAPNARGVSLFPDFWEWLDFLADFSGSVDYDWFVKPHPDAGDDAAILDDFCDRHPEFTQLPVSTSHHQLIRDGVTAVLSVYGTVGSELPLLGVPVINASNNSFHEAYDFCFHADSVTAYEDLLRSIPSLPRPGPRERQKLLEFYFLHHIFTNKNLFFNDWSKLWKKSNGRMVKATPRAYDIFLDAFSREVHTDLVSRISAFIDSRAYRLDGSGMLIPSKEHGLKVSR